MVLRVSRRVRLGGGAAAYFILLGATGPAGAQTSLAGAAAPVPASSQLPAVAQLASAPQPVAANPAAAKSTRFVIGLERTAKFTVSALPSPNRVIVDLPEMRLSLPQPSESPPPGLVKSFYGGLSAPGKARVVIDVAEPVIVESAQIVPAADGKSQQLVLDILPLSATATAPQAKGKAVPAPTFTLGGGSVQPPLPRPAARPAERAAKAFKHTIVIDPGHGGQDSGATKFGTVEKDVVLAFSKVLRDKLISTGRYNVLMTRDSDIFVDLDARREFAEKNKAALFIAVHADYASTGARGATIYSLRDGVANELKRSAKGEVSSNVLTANEMAALKKSQVGADLSMVQNMLADLAQREVDVNKERTGLFTRSVIENMGVSTSMRDNPDRTAAFRVLKTAQVPAVLIELAYVSNQQDARNLKSDTWRLKVADSITTAVENYFSHQLARLPM